MWMRSEYSYPSHKVNSSHLFNSNDENELLQVMPTLMILQGAAVLFLMIDLLSASDHCSPSIYMTAQPYSIHVGVDARSLTKVLHYELSSDRYIASFYFV